MIKEDYVSFEVAKLLKEKGFNWHTPEQRNLFFEENKDLIKDYLMID